jgi:formylglycine-generating enzyme required for sulfatase activity
MNRKLFFTLLMGFLVWSDSAFAGDYTNSIGMKFKEIPSGSFMMGTPMPKCPKDAQYEACIRVGKLEAPVHKVTLKGFYMGETEVTQGQWQKIMGNTPSHFQNGDMSLPVENVNWYDVKEFIQKLNSKEKTNKYTLPTEAEWEYAARAGTTTKWSCGDDESCLSDIAWYSKNSEKKTHPVATKCPNAWGLYDMSGNVEEWTESCYTKGYNSKCNQDTLSVRGGDWNSFVVDTRSANRSVMITDDSGSNQGFRVMMRK